MPLFAGCCQLAFATCPDLLPPALQPVLGRDVPNGAVQPDLVVLLDEPGYDASGILQAERCLRPDAVLFQCLVPPLHLAIALRIEGRCSHVRQATQPDESLEITRYELWAIVRDDPWCCLRECLQSTLQDGLHIRFGHALPDLPMHHVPAVTVKDAAKIVECSADIQVRDVNMPMLVRPMRLVEAFALGGGPCFPTRELSSLFQHTIDAAGAHRHHSRIQQHVA